MMKLQSKKLDDTVNRTKI